LRKAPKNWNLWIKLHNSNSNIETVNVHVEKRSTALQHKDEYQVMVAGHPPTIINAQWPLESPLINAQLHVPNQSERSVTVQYLEPLPVGFRLQYMGTKFDITIHNQRQHELSQYMIEKPKKDLSKVIISPMPGSVVSVAVNVGDIVNEGVEVAVVEAMKMQNVLRASRIGKVKRVNVKPGSSVAAEEVIIEFEDEASTH